MATTSSSLPDTQQQPQDQAVPNPEIEAVPSTTTTTTWHSSSGSIGPFFVVVSVLAVLAILSCLLGRYYSRRTAMSPLESIHHRGCFGWLRRKLGRCTAGHDSEVGDHVINVCKAQSAV